MQVIQTLVFHGGQLLLGNIRAYLAHILGDQSHHGLFLATGHFGRRQALGLKRERNLGGIVAEDVRWGVIVDDGFGQLLFVQAMH